MKLEKSQFLLPGFIDCHIHAAQMPNIGLGLDMGLLDWLNTYTFPLEAEYKDEDFARHVYKHTVVSSFLYSFQSFNLLYLLIQETNTEFWYNNCLLFCNESQKWFNHFSRRSKSSRTESFCWKSFIQSNVSRLLCVSFLLPSCKSPKILIFISFQ